MPLAQNHWPVPLRPAASAANLSGQTIGFGCCPMGMHGWGNVAEVELVNAVKRALDLGIYLFDTSDIYGLGMSETILGRALAGRRGEASIATKFGVRRVGGKTFYDNSAAWIFEAVEGSLRRLGTDYIDLYQLHFRDEVTPADEIRSALEKLHQDGKIRSFGVTNCDPRAFGSNTCSFSYHYSLVQREYEEKIAELQSSAEFVFMSWGSLGQGVLSGKYAGLEQLSDGDRRHRPEYANFHGERHAAIQLLLPELERIRHEVGATSVTQIALRWIIQRFPRSIPLVGIKRPQQIEDAAGALRVSLNAAVMHRLDSLSQFFKTPPPLQ